MGFFQDLKEDLSLAVNELMLEETLEESNKEGKGKKEVKETEKETEEITVMEEVLPEPEEEIIIENKSIEEIPESSAVIIDEAELEAMLEQETAMKAENEDEIEELEEIEESNQAFLEEEMLKALERVTMPSKTETIRNKGENGKMAENGKLTGVASDETAIITAGMTISGDVSSKGSMEVLGVINGNVEVLGKLDIAGTINGDSKATEIFADSASINGEVRSEKSVKIGQSSVIIGNVYATSAVIAGAVKGDIDVMGPVILDTTAIVMGNIKSKSVQINNGAVIEGLCSQCYADVNPTAFFDDLKKKK